jgi:integrase
MGVVVRQKIPGKGKPWWVFVAHNGKRTSRRVGAKSAAELAAANIEAKLTLGTFDWEEGKKEEPKEPTFKEYADTWITTNAPANCKESTVDSYDDILRLHVLPVFGDLKLTEINRGKLKDFFAGKILDGYAKSTVVHMKAAISNILNNAVDKEVVPTNLALGIKISKKTRDEDGENGNGDRNVYPLTAEETSLFLITLCEHFPKDHPLCLLLLRTGMRIGEALALKWGDIDFNGRFIHVQRGLSRMKIQTPKNGKTRRVDMSQQLAEALTAYKTECKKKGLALGLGDAPEYVFTNENGGFIISSNWRKRVFWKALEKAKLRRVRIHDLRHTYATLRISKGDSITDVSNQLGHYSVKLTLDVYNHWLPGGNKDQVDGLDSLGTRKEEKKNAQNEG